MKTAPEDDKGRKIEGKVTDKDKLPLPGVTVLIKGTTGGVVTDTDGKFQLTLPGNKEITLQFSFVGMKTKEVKVTDDKPLQIVLEEDVTEVEEVVVNGIFQRKAGSSRQRKIPNLHYEFRTAEVWKFKLQIFLLIT